MASDQFDMCIRDWSRAACEAWRCPEPGDDYYERISRRLPDGLRSLIALGVGEGYIIPDGAKFTLKGLPGKGPYAWFSRRSTPAAPSPNWEYFVQVAEFVRLSRIAGPHGFRVTFEDHLMDLALYDETRLLVCCEVKERASQAQELIRRIREYESGVNLAEADRGNDPLRKAKYIVKRQPPYFSVVAIGVRLEFRVRHLEGRRFELIRDVIPWI